MRTLFLTLITCLFVLPAHAKYSGGTGEPNDPYQIATAEDLMALGETPEDYDKHFILTADIDLDPNLPGRKVFDRAVIAPDTNDIENGFQGPPFTGNFNGNGYTVFRLMVRGVRHVGLFGQVGAGAKITGLGVEGVDINGAVEDTGALAGWNNGSITNCHSAGTISGHIYVGGLVGRNGYFDTSALLIHCYSLCTVNGDMYVGGLVGFNQKSIIVGHSAGVVRGVNSVGGLAGENWGDIAASHSTAMASGSLSIGGLVGANPGSVSTSSGGGLVSGETCVGGLVGNNECGGSIATSYSTGVVDGRRNVGGLVGQNGPAILGCHSSVVNRCYSTGAVHGDEGVGGLVGGGTGETHSWSGIVTQCFWDMEISGQTTSDGGVGKTTAEMQDIYTYLDAGWDFVAESRNGLHEVWRIPEEGGYPTLAIFNGYEPPRLQGEGTPLDPYMISNASELGAMVYYSPSAHYQLAASIDLSDVYWGTAVIPIFTGMFDGNDLTISHLTIEGVHCLGLFGRIACGAEVKNLHLEDVNVTGTYEYIGGLVGRNRDNGKVTRCSVTGQVSGGSSVGGLVGVNDPGGLVTDSGGVVTDCSAHANTLGDWFMGGLVGENGGVVKGSYSAGVVSGGNCVGGLVGLNGGSEVCGDINNCYSTAAVKGNSSVGGLVGWNLCDSVVMSYSTGSVMGDSFVGGLIGEGWAASTDSSFWDIQTSGQTTSGGGTGKTTAEMQTASTFLEAGWDFVDETANGTEDIWWVLEGKDYPRLWWENAPQ